MRCTEFCRCYEDGTQCERFHQEEPDDQFENIGLSDEND